MSPLKKISLSLLLVVSILSIHCRAGPTPVEDDEDTDQIVGGKAANLKNYRFLTALIMNNKFFCGGSLVTPTKVVTAAHCVDDLTSFDLENLSILLNSAKISPPDRSSIQRGVSSIAFHSGWNNVTNKNDIAVITLDEPVDAVIKPIPLAPVGSKSYVNKWVKIAGFGRTQYTPAGQKSQGPTSNVMLESRVKVISNDDCNEMYGNIDNSQVCAFAKGTDTCQGDSGGPLILDGVLIGVVSYGNGCADEEYAGVYTKVSSFQGWLKKHLV